METPISGTILQILQGMFLVILSPTISGLLNYFRYREQHRPRRVLFIFQPYLELRKYLFRQPAVRARTTSWFFMITPWIVFAVYGWLAFIVPVFDARPLISADLIIVVYVLGLARFTLSLAAIDSGSSFGGLGSSREMFFQILAEVGLVMVLAALAMQWNTIVLTDLFLKHANTQMPVQNPELIFLSLSLAVLILVECERIPVGSPETTLELTMSQEGGQLEFAGRDLGLLRWAEMIKLTFMFILFSNLFLPFLNLANWQFLPLPAPVLRSLSLLINLIVLCWLVAKWELGRPKMRIRQVASLCWISMLFSLVTIIFISIWSK